jgi:hypothetical protein
MKIKIHKIIVTCDRRCYDFHFPVIFDFFYVKKKQNLIIQVYNNFLEKQYHLY